MRAERLHRALRTIVLGLVVTLFACTSAEEKCEQARVASEGVWRAHLETLENARRRALDTQAKAQLELTQIEPRLSQGAADVASARYDRNTDAWQRAFVVAQATACANDARCKELRSLDSEARAQQAEIQQKIEVDERVLEQLRKSAARAHELAEQIVPMAEETLLAEARKQTAAMYDVCKDLPPPKAATE